MARSSGRTSWRKNSRSFSRDRQRPPAFSNNGSEVNLALGPRFAKENLLRNARDLFNLTDPRLRHRFLIKPTFYE